MKPRTGHLLAVASDTPQTAMNAMSDKHAKAAFTGTDLLAVVCILLVLATLLASARARAAGGAPAAVCLENMRRLALAWHLYASDHGGQLVNNLGIPEVQDSISSRRNLNWANNIMDWSANPFNTNLQLTASSKLFPYLQNTPNVFRCPSDTYLSPMQLKAGWNGRARSYSMNGSMGSPFQRPSVGSSTAMGISEWCPERRQFLNLAAIPQPSGLFVFLEEHPDSINDGLYLLGCDQSGSWSDLPAAFHDGACSFAFADGHVELHPWLYEGTKRRVSFTSISAVNVPSNAREDYQWVLNRTAVPPSELAVRRGAGNQMLITWSRLPANYVVQVTEQLSSGTWTNAALVREGSLGHDAVRVPLDSSQRFFRLAR